MRPGVSNRYYALRPSDMTTKIKVMWNIYVFSLGHIKIDQAEIRGPRIGLCSNEVNLQDTLVNSTGQGCTHDEGLGAGILNPGCTGSGGAHGGHGGHGGVESGDQNQINTCMNEVSYPQSYYFGKEAKYEGSGGASGDGEQTGGKGGGLVWITTTGTTTLNNSLIMANGQ